MTIMQMECFVGAARCGSFTKAGENLYISQQTMSRHIRALETGKCVTISYSSMFESLAGKLACYPLAKEEGNPEVSIAWRDEKYATKAQNISRMFENVNHRPE